MEQEVLDTLKGIVGVKNVLDDPDTLEGFSGDESFVHPTRPKCVLRPGSMEEVQEIVKWANTTRTPLVPVSSGPPRFRGDTVPSLGGSIIVDLSGMKKIIRVDRRNRIAMVEPGVTFGELIPELEKEGLAPMIPFVPRSTKSVLAAALEREPILTPRHHWENLDPLLCTEVVYGTGDLFRTGSAAGPGTLEEQWKVGGAQMFAEGPSQTDFVRVIQGAEGTIGISTWATVTCRILPKVKKYFLVSSENIAQLIDASYKLFWKRLGEQCLIINNQTLSCVLSKDQDEAKSLREQLPSFMLFVSLEGGGLIPDEKIKYQEAELKDVFQSFGLEPAQKIGPVEADQVAEVLAGPSEEPYWKLRNKGGWQDIFFLSTLDRVPDFVSQVTELANDYRYSQADMGIYIQPTVQGSNCHCEFGLPYDPKNREEVENVKAFVTDGSKTLASNGAFFSRPYGPWKDFAYGPDPENVAAFRKVKNVWDPNNILNPGKLCFEGA